jgi:pyridoxine/pyridoxamine 5'-phosphate oxidase
MSAGPERGDLTTACALIDRIRIALLTTIDHQGRLHSRPVQTLQVESNALWFFTDCNSPKASELERDARVSLGYADPQRHTFAVVSGTGRLLRDSAKAAQLWSVEQREPITQRVRRIHDSRCYAWRSIKLSTGSHPGDFPISSQRRAQS